MYALHKTLGIEATYGRRWRTLISRVEDKAAFDEVFRLHNTVQLTPDRNVITSVDGEYQWVSGVNLSQVMQLGSVAMKKNQESGFKIPVGPSMKLLDGIDELGMDATGVSLPADNFAEEEEIESNSSEQSAPHRATDCAIDTSFSAVLDESESDEDDDLNDENADESDDDDVILTLNNGLCINTNPR